MNRTWRGLWLLRPTLWNVSMVEDELHMDARNNGTAVRETRGLMICFQTDWKELTVTPVISVAIHESDFDTTLRNLVDGVNGDFEWITCHAEEHIGYAVRTDAEV
jgi:hypothetical protein